MKPTELRIGNMVHSGTILELHENHALVSDEISKSHVEKYYDMVPVKLTEKWMIRFGYKKQEGKGFDADHYTHKTSRLYIHYYKSLSSDDFAWDCYRNEGRERIWIDSVHQLQNLHYQLEGNELEFNIIPNEIKNRL